MVPVAMIEGEKTVTLGPSLFRRVVRLGVRFGRFVAWSGSVLREQGPAAFAGHWRAGVRRFATAVFNDVTGRTVRAVSWRERTPQEKRRAIEDAAAAAMATREPLLAGASAGAPDLPSGDFARPKLIAFYLPQFHRTELNDQWWGEGFTEWTNVRQARPNYEGHLQPVEPGELGYYDLDDPEILDRQAGLARAHGIHGFCFYYYWFGGGRRMLEWPLRRFLARGRPPMPFCICWANDTWSRTWHGREHEILMKQEYASGFAEEFIAEAIPIFKDERYIRVGGAPLLLVYRPAQLPDAPAVAGLWRDACRRAGLSGLHLAMVQHYDVVDPRVYGFDAAVEFPPNVRTHPIAPATFPGMRPEFRGRLMDYVSLASERLAAPPRPYVHYRGVIPGWDNTPRWGDGAHLFVGSSPDLYGLWLEKAVELTLRRATVQEPLVFLNAWNEWGEGAYLEPDRHEGRARLEATRDGLARGIRAHQLTQAAVPSRTIPIPKDS